MKIKNLVLFVLLTLLFLSDNGWYLSLIYDPTSTNNATRTFLLVANWILFFLVLFLKNWKFKRKSFSWVIYFFLFNIVLSTLVGGVLVFNQRLIDVALTIFRYGGILIYFVLSAISERVQSKKMFKIIIFYGIVQCILVIVLILWPDVRNYFDSSIFSTRFGLTRIKNLTTLSGEFSFCYFFSCIFSRIKQDQLPSKLKSYAGLILTSISFLVIGDTRGFQLGLFLILFFIAFFPTRSNFFNKKGIGLAVLLVIVVFGGLLLTGIFSSNQFVNSLSPNENSTENHNVAVRIKAAQFYLGELAQTYFIGTGWISTKSEANENEILGAIQNQNYFAIDIGILGTFCMYGIISMFVYYFFYRISFSLLKGTFDYGLIDYQLMSCTIYLFLILQLGTFTLGTLFYWSENSYFYGLIMFLSEAIWLSSERTVKNILRT